MRESSKTGMASLERWLPLSGIAAIAVLALLVNVLAGRHFKRWDFTSEKRYALSPATLETLHDLRAPVEVWVLLPAGDPLRLGIRQLLVSYATETDKIDVHYMDPDRDPVGYGDLRTRFGIERGKVSQEGVVTEEAVVVVAQGARHWFITPSDLVQVVSEDDARIKPRSERALTGAIRNVQGGAKPTLCFTSGQGELSLDEPGAEGIAFLRGILQKDNYLTKTVDLTAPADPLTGCAVTVVAGARTAFGTTAAERLRSYLLGGGNALIAASPINADTDSGMTNMGLDRVLAPFGVAFEDALVIETADGRVYPAPGQQWAGMLFAAEARPHPLTAALTGDKAPQIILHFARPLRAVNEQGAPTPSPLVATSADAYAVTRIKGAAGWEQAPRKTASDLAGPLTLAYASERPKVQADAPHGPRLVAIGTGSAFIEENWKLPGSQRGMVMLLQSAIGWLAAKPQVLDVPDKADSAIGVRISEESRAEVTRYVLVYMPLAAIALALGVYFRRRSTEGAKLAKLEGDPPADKKRAAGAKRSSSTKKSSSESAGVKKPARKKRG